MATIITTSWWPVARMGCGAGSSRSGANIARMGYGAVSTWSAWYEWASCPDARAMFMVLCIRLIFVSACTYRARQTHSAGWLKLLDPTCPVQFGSKSFQPFLILVICVSVQVQLELSTSQDPQRFACCLRAVYERSTSGPTNGPTNGPYGLL